MSGSDIDKINISTMTVIVTTNLDLNLEWLFGILPVTVFPTERVFKSSREFQDFVVSHRPLRGTITMVQHKENLRGFKLKKKKSKFFRNALSMVMFVGKLVTIKIPKQGKMQLTGCIAEHHTKDCIQVLWTILSAYSPSPDTYTFVDGTPTHLHTTLRTVMTDIVFNVGFDINRQRLDHFMNRNTDFNSLLETSFGYTGVNIKVPFDLDLSSPDIKQYTCMDGEWRESVITYDTYVQSLPPKERQKEISKRRKNTFLVFHSGTAIMSGMTIRYMKDVYTAFHDLLVNARHEIEERLG